MANGRCGEFLCLHHHITAPSVARKPPIPPEPHLSQPLGRDAVGILLPLPTDPNFQFG